MLLRHAPKAKRKSYILLLAFQMAIVALMVRTSINIKASRVTAVQRQHAAAGAEKHVYSQRLMIHSNQQQDEHHRQQQQQGHHQTEQRHQPLEPTAGAHDEATAIQSHTPGGPSLAQLLPAATLNYFPQVERCHTQWVQDYRELHAGILAGSFAPRYLVSVPPAKGFADKLVGTMTHLWHAVLTDRALVSAPYDQVPGLEAVCNAPMFNWTAKPPPLPAEALQELRPLPKGHPSRNRTLPSHLDNSTYQLLYLVDPENKHNPMYQEKDLRTAVSPDPAVLLATSNRGYTYSMATNPHHRQWFQDHGTPPTDALMCGFFFMCSPVAAIQQYYQPYWDVLRQPDTLTIGIQIRLGDKVFAGEEGNLPPGHKLLQLHSVWFDCAARLEAAYAAPGQKVLWFLNSDSKQLRRAAKQAYGAKLITDSDLAVLHPVCSKNTAATTTGSSDCDADTVSWAMWHSLGAILTFSMTDYHVISYHSGFGRAAAWLADRRDHIYQVRRNSTLDSACRPGFPVPPAESSEHWSRI